MLSALQGLDSQLESHISISLNTGLTVSQLNLLTQVLADRVDVDAAQRAREALARHLAKKTTPK
jgi:alkylhydroperoxidase/carboxymuconolactone decarboxylase family protein YurZ